LIIDAFMGNILKRIMIFDGQKFALIDNTYNIPTVFAENVII